MGAPAIARSGAAMLANQRAQAGGIVPIPQQGKDRIGPGGGGLLALQLTADKRHIAPTSAPNARTRARHYEIEAHTRHRVQ